MMVVPEDSSAEARPRSGPSAGAGSRVVISAEEALAVPESALLQAQKQLRVAPQTEPGFSLRAIISMALGIAGAPLVGILVGWFAIWFGVLALREIEGPERLRGRGLALSGIALGAVDIVLWLFLLVIYGPEVFSHHSSGAAAFIR